MVIAAFKTGTNMSEVMAVVAEERAQVRVLASEGRIGSIHISLPRQTVFLEIFADDEAAAEATVMTLPMSEWWTLDIYPTPAPTLPAPPSSTTDQPELSAAT
jgi:muconolactone delta-isomerase